jgi:hypothetical protein
MSTCSAVEFTCAAAHRKSDLPTSKTDCITGLASPKLQRYSNASVEYYIADATPYTAIVFGISDSGWEKDVLQTGA